MKSWIIRTITLVILILIYYVPAIAQNPGDTVFSGNKVYDINIKFSQSNYWDSLTYYYNQGLEQYIPATVIIDNVTYNNVGVRFKGNSSFNYPNNKKSFRLGFDQYITDQRWDQMKGVHLNNMWGDPSFLREKVHLDFLKDISVAAPRANFARLFINDTLWSFYSLVEHVDKNFLKTRFGNKNGDLFKAVDAIADTGTAAELISDFLWYGSNESSYYSRYELKTDGSTTAWPALVNLIDSLNNISNTAAVLSAKINLTSFYKAIACDILFGNLDSYVSSGRNFYAYFLPTTNKVEWIVWDAGLSFGAYQKNMSNPETMSVLYGNSFTDRPLVSKLLSIDSLKKNYLQSMYTILYKHFTQANLYPHIDSLANMIRPYVNADSRKMYTNQQFELNINSDVNATGGLGTRKPGLKSFINSRINSVKTQLANLGITGIEDRNISETLNFNLYQNYPNPFNPNTIIGYDLNKKSNVKLEIFNILGQLQNTLVNEVQESGSYRVSFSASGLPAGNYFYKLSTDNKIKIMKMSYLK